MVSETTIQQRTTAHKRKTLG